MLSEAFLKDLSRALPGLEVRRGEPMSAHTTLHIGGPAAAMAFPRGDELEKTVAFALKSGVKPLLIGCGSNILAPDGELDRFVIVTRSGEPCIRVEETSVFAEAGATLAKIAAAVRDAGLTGFEFAAGIPGSLGGALLMNAGAYGGEMKDVAASTVWLDGSGIERETRGAEHRFSYRDSIFAHEESYILSCRIGLSPGDPEAIRARMDELAEKRRASQPLDLPSAGSAFKRPAGGYAAAMIDQCGLRGERVGGAGVSEKHAGFIVNTGGATCADVLELIEKIRRAVFERFGTELEPEIRVVK
jgi:UDP-N-acetylmuramate dehydrogenase